MRPRAVLLESSLSNRYLCSRNRIFILHSTAACTLFKRKKKKNMRKPQFCGLGSSRKFKLTACIKPGNTSAKHLRSVLGENLLHSCAKAEPVQPERHGAGKTPHDSSSRPSSWEDVLILYKKIYKSETGCGNSLGNSALSRLIL